MAIMEINLPKPSREWFRFSIRTILVFTFVVAVGIASWRAYWELQVSNAIQARDAALRDWLFNVRTA